MPNAKLIDGSIVLLRKTGKIKILRPDKYWINRNTPGGEPADFYEYKPFNGRRLISQEEILGTICKGELEVFDCKLTGVRWGIISQLPFPLSKRLFHNGQVYATIDNPFRTLEQALKENARAKRKTKSR